MDNYDKKILEFLQENGKITAKELADKISLSQTPIYERIKKFEKAGVIKRYVALLEPNLLNKNLVVFMNITIKQHDKNSRDKFIEKVARLNQVSEFYHTSGTFDFLIKVRFANIIEYKNFLVNEIASIENIGDIDSQIVLEEIKSTTSIYID